MSRHNPRSSAEACLNTARRNAAAPSSQASRVADAIGGSVRNTAQPQFFQRDRPTMDSTADRVVKLRKTERGQSLIHSRGGSLGADPWNAVFSDP
jgi:hypothetical protein